MITIDQLNKLSQEDFVRVLGGIYEHSPWVAEEAWNQRPFPDRNALIAAMRSAVDEAGTSRKLDLLKAHPDLAGKLAVEERLTEASQSEQASLGLDRLASADFFALTDLNEDYRARFEFPFIVCVRRVKDIPELLRIFRDRINHDPATEQETALDEVHLIAQLRVTDLVGGI